MDAPVVTPTPSVIISAGNGHCDQVGSILESCAAATPNFFATQGPVAASCLCYSGSVYQPNIYDVGAKTCAAYLSTANPSVYSAQGFQYEPPSPCDMVGNVAGATSTYLGSTPATLAPTSTGSTGATPGPTSPPSLSMSAELPVYTGGAASLDSALCSHQSMIALIFTLGALFFGS